MGDATYYNDVPLRVASVEGGGGRGGRYLALSVADANFDTYASGTIDSPDLLPFIKSHASTHLPHYPVGFFSLTEVGDGNATRRIVAVEDANS